MHELDPFIKDYGLFGLIIMLLVKEALALLERLRSREKDLVAVEQLRRLFDELSKISEILA